MAKAAPAEQLKLLELQGLDAKLKSLSNRRRSLESDSRITDLEAALSVANGELGAAKVAVHDAELELKRAEADVEQVASRIERDEARLNSGTGLSKDLVALQRDLVSLNKRRSDLEDVELEVLERLDSLRLRQATQQQIVDDIQGSFGSIRCRAGRAARRDRRRGHRGARPACRVRRRDWTPECWPIYEKTLAKRGVGAARLFHGTSEGSGMQLSPGDLAEIKAAAEDDIVFCPDSGCILVPLRRVGLSHDRLASVSLGRMMLRVCGFRAVPSTSSATHFSAAAFCSCAGVCGALPRRLSRCRASSPRVCLAKWLTTFRTPSTSVKTFTATVCAGGGVHAAA